MKIHGQKVEGVNEQLVVLPRPDGARLVFKVRAVTNYEEFDKLCPLPTPPKIFRISDQQHFENVEDPKYKLDRVRRFEKEMHWLFLKSLAATDGLEWEQVRLEDSNSWHLYENELNDSGVTKYEVAILRDAVLKVNALDREHIEAARADFVVSLRSAKAS
jgi:hypothetical protein